MSDEREQAGPDRRSGGWSDLGAWVFDRIDRYVVVPGPARQVGEQRRLRVISAALLSIVVVAILAVLVALVTRDLVIGLAAGCGGVICIAILAWVRRGASAAQASHALGFSLTSLILFGSLLTNGLLGPGPFSFVAVPVLVTLSLGGRAGWAWCAVVVVCDLVLAAVTDGPPDAIRLYLLNAILDAVVLTACAHAFDAMRRQALDEANDARVRAEDAVEAKGRFLANMSHEIRTPMNGVLGMLELLLDSRLSGSQREYAKIAQASGVILLELIDDILDVSKIEAGQMAVEQTPFELRGLVEDVLEQATLDAESKGVVLACRYPETVPDMVVGDGVRMRQVLVNLVSNAIKFTHKGHVLISVGWDPSVTAAGQRWVRMEVQDTGIGIPAERQVAVFEQFQQVDMSTTRNYGGTGLGLAIVRELVALMGGRVGVDSELGRGSTFWVSLPLVTVEPAKERTVAAQWAGRRVLVVGGYPLTRALLVEQLSELGLSAVGCATGDEALEHLSEAPGDDGPPLALIDHDVPGMGGLQLGHRIGEDAQTQGTVRALLGGVSRRASAEQLAEAGFVAHLVKPVHRADLLELLATAWSGPDRSSADDPSPGSGSRAGAEPVERIGSRVLVVEDNAINQKVARRMLERLGCRVDVASDGRAALQQVESVAYDLVFMDVQMPVMDGLDAVARIRRRERERQNRGRRLPVVAMTAHAMQSDRERCLAAGMDDYISKPVERQELVRVLRSLGVSATMDRGDSVTPSPSGD
ncbi:MAG: response regulator [Nannocystaceae bacterium]